jgi:hypothetical protein
MLQVLWKVTCEYARSFIFDMGGRRNVNGRALSISSSPNFLMLTLSRDLQTILGMTWPLPITMYSTGGSPPFTPDQLTPSNTNEPYLAFLLDLRSRKTQDIPKTISISYGDSEQTVPRSYAQSVCSQFAALGAMGVSFLVASGKNILSLKATKKLTVPGDFGVGKTGKCTSVSASPLMNWPKLSTRSPEHHLSKFPPSYNQKNILVSILMRP